MKPTLMVLFGIALAQNAAAQQLVTPLRGYVVINGAYQMTANDFSDGAVRREHAEDGRIDATYTVKGGPAFDIAGGARIWRSLGVGIGVTRFTVSTPTALAGTVPHPFFFDRLRSVGGEASGLNREELALHVQARGVFPVTPRFQIMVFGGPSFFQIKQGMVTDFTYSDSYPYDEATFRSAVTTTTKVSKLGLGGGGDVAFFFTRQVGVGGTFQFAGTTAEVPSAAGAVREIKVGGAKAGAGLRLRF